MGDGEKTDIAKLGEEIIAQPVNAPVKSPPEKPNLTNRGIVIPVLAGAITVFGTINYLLSIAGLWSWWHVFTVRVIAEAARGQVVAAAVALVSGFIALVTFTVNYHQKIYLQKLANFQAEQIADENREKQNEWELTRIGLQEKHFKDQRNQEKAQAEYDSIAKEYDALSKDFVAKEELARINAAIGLAAIAMRPDPRRLFEEEKKPEAAPKDRNYYPWFERVASQLAAALITYERASERAQVRSSIRVIAKIDKVQGQPLLHFMIHQIADANRTAYARLIETFAEGMACEKPTHLRTYARAVNVFPKPVRNAKCLKELVSTEDYAMAYRAQRDLRRLRGDATPGDPNPEYLERLRRVSEQLVDTRDAIADCLKKGVRVVEIVLEEGESWIEGNKFNDELLSQKLLNVTSISLDEIFLQGANMDGAQLQGANMDMAQLQRASLDGAQLQGASLDRAQLQGASLRWAQLQGASLDGAQLQRASLDGAQLQGANMIEAQLQRASLYWAQLQGAKLDWAQLQGAKLDWAQLQGASLDRAQLQGASLRWAQLQGASLDGAQLQRASLDGAQLQGANMIEAQLQRASLYWAQLQGAKLDWAQLQGAKLDWAQLQGASLDRAQLQGASLRWAQLQGAKLAGIKGLNDDPPPTFERTHVWEADFNVWQWSSNGQRNVRTDEVDTEVRDWFEEHYPPPVDKGGGE